LTIVMAGIDRTVPTVQSHSEGAIAATLAKGDCFSSRRIAMPDLVVIVYPSESKAEDIRQKLLSLQKEYLIELQDAVIATKDKNGRVRLNQLISPTAIGAITGSWWGLLIGAIFLMPVMGVMAGVPGLAIGAASGAALGAATGAIGGALTDLGIDDDFMKQLASKLEPGGAALFLLIRRMTTDKVLAAIKGTGGEVIKTSLDTTKEEALRRAVMGLEAVTAAA
jgi:uncharacterized membrane protein